MNNWMSEFERFRGKALFFEAQANSSLDGILVVDQNGRKLYQNHRCNELWKVPPEIYQDPDDSVQIRYAKMRVKDPAQFERRVQRLYDEQDQTDRTELELVDGTVLDRYSAPVYDTVGRYHGRIWTFRDITERKQNERALQLAHVELEARVAQRTQALSLALTQVESANRAKTEFLSRMSHELRTPLNAILGFGQLLGMDDITDLQRESVGLILTAGNHLLGLINEILDIAGLESGSVTADIESVSVDETIEEMCALVGPMAEKRDVRIFTEVGKHVVLADARRLKQVLINLLSNGIKYNKKGGKLSISCSELDADRIRISVSDTGEGIAPDDLEKIFTPFERLDGYRTDVEGTGLGLFIAQRLIAAMSGSIAVESELGVGSTFTVELPRAQGESGAPLSEPMVESVESLGCEGAGVLCIEDNASNLRLMEVILRSKRNVNLVSADRGAVGLEMAKKSHPDLILLDLNLPDMHGFDVLGKLRSSAITANIPVVVTSADATQYQIDRMMAAGAAAYLTKPLDVAQLLQTFDEMVARPALSA